MDIITFARLHGVLIDRLLEDGRWHRVPTASHPKKKNGAYMSRGDYGFVQDHATMQDPAAWKPEGAEAANIDHEAIARRAREASEQIRRDQEKAAKRAGWILHQCSDGVDGSGFATHPYLASKGFSEERGHVWKEPATGALKLCLPMRADGRLVGLQMIGSAEGFEKKFLYGQRTSEAVYVIDNKGPKIFVEGYATGLSVAAAMHSLKQRFTLIVCFTAGNLLKVARNHGEGLVVADNDHPYDGAPEYGGTGLRVAKETGLPYWLSDTVGEDFNDFHQRAGMFRASQSLKAAFFVKAKP